MTLSKKAVAELAHDIRQCRVMAVAHAEQSGDRSSGVYPYMVGALSSTITHFVQSQKSDSTEIREAFDYEPTPEDIRIYREEEARSRARYEQMKRERCQQVAGGAQ